MPRVKEYFDETTYKSQYLLGDRVKFQYNNQYYTGTVALDHLVDLDCGPLVHIFPDQPEIDGKKITVYTTRHSEVSKLN